MKPFYLRVCLAALLAGGCSALADSKWETLEGCKLLSNSSNDGDSFHVQHHGREYIFRLYYVDTPETEDDYPERVSEQAAYFKVSHQQALRIGKTAARFTAVQLRTNFIVITRWDNARGNSKLPRFYAFITVNGKDLAETLVEQGLARVFGEKVIPPKGNSTKAVVDKLQRLERAAKRERRGAWGRSTEKLDEPAPLTPLMPPLPNPKMAATPPSVPAAPTSTDTTNSTTQVQQEYRISKNGDRHNQKCRYFDSPNNKPCGSTDGRACLICGG